MATNSLTGAFDTGRLPRIADEPVTVTVSRRPRPGREREFEAWVAAMAARVEDFPGNLGVGVLRPGQPNGEWHIVVRFVDGLSLRAWERSPQRAALLADVDALADDIRVQRTVGVDEWFGLAERAEPSRSHWRRLAGDLVWVYPVALGAGVFLSPFLAKLSLGLRTLASAGLITLIMQMAIGPVRKRVRARRRFG